MLLKYDKDRKLFQITLRHVFAELQPYYTTFIHSSKSSGFSPVILQPVGNAYPISVHLSFPPGVPVQTHGSQKHIRLQCLQCLYIISFMITKFL
jgi:hypothetical protein